MTTSVANKTASSGRDANTLLVVLTAASTRRIGCILETSYRARAQEAALQARLAARMDDRLALWPSVRLLPHPMTVLAPGANAEALAAKVGLS